MLQYPSLSSLEVTIARDSFWLLIEGNLLDLSYLAFTHKKPEVKVSTWLMQRKAQEIRPSRKKDCFLMKRRLRNFLKSNLPPTYLTTSMLKSEIIRYGLMDILTTSISKKRLTESIQSY